MRIRATRVQGLAQGGIAALMPSLMLDFTREAESGRSSAWWNLFKGGVTTPDEFVNAGTGAVTYGPHNVLQRSQEIGGTGWSNFSAVVTLNAGVAPDGTNTATRLDFPVSTPSARMLQGSTIASGEATFSVWIRGADGTSGSIDLQTQAFPGEASYLTVSFTGSWQRVSKVYVATAINGSVGVRNNTNAAVSVEVWGAQLNLGPLQTYVATTVAAVYSNIPRITFSRASLATRIGPTGLVEWSPHNFFRNSETQVTADSQSSYIVVDPASTVTKSGVLLRKSTVAAAANGNQTYYGSSANLAAVIRAGTKQSVSWLVKKGTAAYSWTSVYTGTVDLSVFLNLDTGQVTTTGTHNDYIFSGKAVDLGDGVWKFSAEFTNRSSSDSTTPIKVGGISSSTSIYLAVADEFVYQGGFQVNHGSLQPYYPTGSTAYHGPRFTHNAEVLGPNLITNGGFDSSLSGWTASAGGWTQSDGAAQLSGNGAYQPLIQSGVFTPGKTYRITFNCTQSGSALTVRNSIGAFVYIATSGANSLIWTADFADLVIARQVGTMTATVDSVVVREVLGIESFGPEMLTNGDFSLGTANWTLIGNGPFTVSSGVAQLFRVSAFTAIGQSISVVAGKRYDISVQCRRTSGVGLPTVLLRQANDAAATVRASATQTAPVASFSPLTLSYVAVATETLWVQVGVATDAANCEFDNVTVKEVSAASGSAATPLGLLVEEQRTNILLWSQSFDKSSWLTFNGASKIAPSGELDPSGGFNSYRINVGVTGGGSVTGAGAVYQGSLAMATATTYTGSVWVRSVSGTSTFRLSGSTASGADTGSSDLTATASWQRFFVTWTTTATLANGTFAVRAATAGGVVGDLLVWGAQVEAGGVPTSYIPTFSASATRSPDGATLLQATGDRGSITSTFQSSRTASSSPRIVGFNYAGAPTPLYVRALNKVAAWTGATPVDSPEIVSGLWEGLNKAAVSWSDGQATVALAGAFNTGPLVVAAAPSLFLGMSNAGGLNCLNGPIAKLAYYPQALTPSALQRLTV